MTYKVHLDGYNFLPLPDRIGNDNARAKNIMYFSDDG